jgi:hypothetical protein
MALLEDFFFGCGHCHGPENCRVAQAEEQARAEGVSSCQGAKLVVPAMIVFLGPLITGMLAAHVVGGWLAGKGSFWLAFGQLAGFAAGAMIGILLARTLTRWMGWRTRPTHGGSD